MRKESQLRESFSGENPKPDPKELRFRCPECGNSDLNQVITATLFSEVFAVYEDGTVDQDLIDEHVEEIFYECADCRYPLEDASGNPVQSEHELVKWLKDNCKENIINVQS